MPLQISIPTPCHEDWNEMTPTHKGRHCSQCDKTVVDFTLSSPQEITFYISQHRSEKLCGRFNTTQIEEPIPTPEDFVKQISYFRMPMLKKIAAIFLFAFSVMAVSCNDHVTGDVAAKVEKTPAERADSLKAQKDSLLINTTIAVPLMGMVAPVVKPDKPVKVVCPVHPPDQLMGDIAVEPIPDSINEIPIKAAPPEPDTTVLTGKIKLP